MAEVRARFRRPSGAWPVHCGLAARVRQTELPGDIADQFTTVRAAGKSTGLVGQREPPDLEAVRSEIGSTTSLAGSTTTCLIRCRFQVLEMCTIPSAV